MDMVGEIVLFSLIVTVVLAWFMLWISWKLLEAGWMLLVWLYEAMKPKIRAVWNAWQYQRRHARKPQDIQATSAAARAEMDQLFAHYRRQVDQILQATPPKRRKAPQVIILSEKDYGTSNTVMEDNYV